MGNFNAKKTGERFGDYYLEDSKFKTQLVVKNRIDEIDYREEVLLQEHEDWLKEEVTDIYAVLLKSGYGEMEESDERQRMVLETIETLIAHKENKRDYFVLTPKGVLLRSTNEGLEGIDLYDGQDSDGVYYTREVLTALDNQEGVIVSYKWPKLPESEPSQKTTFSYYMPEFNLIIGTGFYYDEVITKLQEEVYELLQHYYVNDTNYIFVVGYDGVAHVAANPSLIGYDYISELTTDDKSFHQIFMEAIEETGEGFVTYSYYEKGTDHKSEKTSYVEAIDEWQVYIGMGFHKTAVNREIEKNITVFREQNRPMVLILLIILMFLAVIISVLIRRVYKVQTEYTMQSMAVFTHLVETSDDAVVIFDEKGTVLYQNAFSGRIIGQDFYRYMKNGIIEHKNHELMCIR